MVGQVEYNGGPRLPGLHMPKEEDEALPDAFGVELEAATEKHPVTPVPSSRA